MKIIFSIIRADDGPEKEYALEREIVIFGRNAACGVILDSDIVSGTHALIERVSDKYQLSDLASANGTFLDGQRIENPVDVNVGSLVTFGEGGPQVRILGLESEESRPLSLPDSKTADESYRDWAANLLSVAWWQAHRNYALMAGSVLLASILSVAWLLMPDADETIAQSDAAALTAPESKGVDDLQGTQVSNSRESSRVAPSGAANSSDRLTDLSETDVQTARKADPPTVDTKGVDTENVLEETRSRLVWIGILTGEGGKQRTVPVCTGWCLNDTEVVTAADAIVPLRHDIERLVIRCGDSGDGDAAFGVRDILSLPAAGDRPNNSVLLVASRSLPTDGFEGILGEAETEQAVIASNSTLLRCGFEIPTSRPSADTPLPPPKLTCSVIRTTNAGGTDSKADSSPTRLTGTETLYSTTGHLIVRADGRPLGTALQVSRTQVELLPAAELRRAQFTSVGPKSDPADPGNESADDRRRRELERDRERLQGLADWTNKRFDEPTIGQTRVANFSRKVRRARKIRADVLSHLINLPARENVDGIWTGAGLNQLFDHLGPVALQHIHHLQGVGLPTHSEPSETYEQTRLLRDMVDGLRIPRFHLSGIQCQQGLTGNPLPMNLAFDQTAESQALPLNWPAWFRLHEEFHQPLRRIEEARDACVKAAGSGDYTAAKQLQTAVDAITEQFDRDTRYRRTQSSSSSGDGDRLRRTTELEERRRAAEFLGMLQVSIARFIETDQFPKSHDFSVRLEEYEHPRGVSVVVLLATMQERGLRFAAANRSSEVAHQFIFERMREYYADLFSTSVALIKTEAELEELDDIVAGSHFVGQVQSLWDRLFGH